MKCQICENNPPMPEMSICYLSSCSRKYMARLEDVNKFLKDERDLAHFEICQLKQNIRRIKIIGLCLLSVFLTKILICLIF